MNKNLIYISSLNAKKTPWYKLTLRPHELRDLSIYCAIGVSFVTSMFLWLFYAPAQYKDDIRWISLFWCTIFVFGVAILASIEYFKFLRFWIAAVCLIISQFAVGIYLILKYKDLDFKASEIGFFAVLEIAVLILIFQVVGEKDIRVLWNPWAGYAEKLKRNIDSSKTD
jgi:drug/metabolite transporter (DMT)-like permease